MLTGEFNGGPLAAQKPCARGSTCTGFLNRPLQTATAFISCRFFYFAVGIFLLVFVGFCG
jgi:hypothetical protein